MSKSVVVQSVLTVVIDGQGVGCIVDAVNNYRDRSAEIMDAIVAWEGDRSDRQAEQLQVMITEAVTPKQIQIDELTQERDGIKTAFDLLRADTDTRLAQARDLIQKLTIEVQALQAELLATVNRLKFATATADSAVALVNHLKSDSTEAAIAVTRELRRLDLERRRAEMDAEAAALA